MTDLGFFLEIPTRITNDKGRELWFERLNQQRTYLEFLQVLPTPEINTRVISRVRQFADEFGYGHTPVFLVEPEPIEWGHELPEGRREFLLSEGMELERLPVVTCMAELASGKIAGNAACWSSLTVVWFQEYLALPIDPIVLKNLRAIDWDKYACGYEP